jgi:3-oxoacyl-[acyl-carrier protein] reductase
MAAAIPSGRLGSVEDVGHACLFLDRGGLAHHRPDPVVDGGQVLPESPDAMPGLTRAAPCATTRGRRGRCQ